MPASSVSGVVAIALPVIGFVLAFLATPSGLISIVLMLAALMFAIWTVEDLESVGEEDVATAPEMTDGIPA